MAGDKTPAFFGDYMAQIQQGQFQDTRPLIERLRRTDLWKICDYHKIDYDNCNEKPDSLIRKILGAGINVAQYTRINSQGWPYVDIPIRQMPKGTEVEVPAVEKTEAVVPKPKQVFATYEEMKVPQLRVLCKQRGIPWTQTEKKVSLIEKLKGFA